MFQGESRKTWIGLGLLGCAAGLLLTERRAYIQWAGLLIASAVWMSSPPGSLNRRLGRIHRDIASGRQARMTTLQMICGLLILVLSAVQIYRELHSY